MIKVGSWTREDLNYALKLEAELVEKAQKGRLGISGCKGIHYPGVTIGGVIQCQHCCAFFENAQALKINLKQLWGEKYWDKEYEKIKELQKKVRRGKNESGPIYHHWVAENGKLKVIPFYYE